MSLVFFLFLFLIQIVTFAPAIASDLCGLAPRLLANCAVDITGSQNNNQVVLDGTASGSSTTHSGGGVRESRQQVRAPLSSAELRAILIRALYSPTACHYSNDAVHAAVMCATPPTETVVQQTPVPSKPVVRQVTLNDLAHFQPNSPTAMMEPNGWALMQVPTNFYSTARTHEQQGRLLGQSAVVRFRPVEYRWNYGDGTQRNLTIPGESWSGLGQVDFTRTATSHRFAQTGTYTVRHHVIYTAEYRWGNGSWRAISGTLALDANTLIVVVGTMETLLFEEHCAEHPVGLGCSS